MTRPTCNFYATCAILEHLRKSIAHPTTPFRARLHRKDAQGVVNKKTKRTAPSTAVHLGPCSLLLGL